jgi:pectin methylesterase-like acyl-CoA thioesterase
MKTKLRLLLFSMLFLVSFAQAQKTDVWDFGGATLDVNLYNNKLTATDINTWYTYSGTIISGTSSSANTLTSSVVQTLTSGVLTLKTGGSDRLYTTNTNITRYGTSVRTTDTNYTGGYYCNGAASSTTRFFTLTLNPDDEVTVVSAIESGYTNNLLTVVNTTTNTQTESIPLGVSGGAVTLAKFQAKQAGDFKISCLGGKGNYFRILRKPATYTTITGTVDETAAPGITGYSVVFTNPAGKVWTAPVTSGTYNVTLPAGYTYQMSLLNANGYIISNGDSLNVLATTTNYNIVALKVDLFTVSGSVTGLGTDISKVALTYTPDPLANKIFIPKPVINTANSTYTVELEPNTQYTVSATGVNNYEILANTITVTGTTTADVAFTNKPVYPVTITTTGLDAAQINSLTLTFTNLNESGYVYTFAPGAAVNLRNGTYAITYSGLNSSVVVMTLTSNLKVTGAATSKTLDFVAPAPTGSIAYASVLTVGTDKTYKTINAALADVTRMTRTSTDRVTIMIDPGNYEEMIDITQANVTLKNAAATPNINLLNKGVDIAAGAVRITSYYGVGYNYYSMKSNQKWDADVLRVNKDNGYQPYTNVSGTTNNSYWNATLLISANGFIAEDIIIENSYNQYISLKESQDVVELASGNKGVRPTTYGSTAVQDKSFVERAAAFAVKNGIDKVILNKCRVVGRQDSFFGGATARVVVYKGVMMGATDYIFGGMDAVFYKTDFAMNTSDASSDVCYITAAQQTSGRGYLMYECKVTSAVPGTETASAFGSKPGYFGRPWAANTSEVVFYNTTIETSTNPSYLGQSLILPLGWNNSLSGESAKMYEYGTIENSGVDNSASRAAWATKLAVPTLTDGTAITTFNFTKGSDNWDPLPQLISNENLGVKDNTPNSAVNVFGYKNRIAISNVKSETSVAVYSITGAKVKSFKTNQDIDFEFQNGVWIVAIKAADGQKSVKVIIH